MKRQEIVQGSGLDTMGLAFAVWICTLPLIGLVIAPVFGPQTAIAIAVASLIGMLILCWWNCILRLIQRFRNRLSVTKSSHKQP